MSPTLSSLKGGYVRDYSGDQMIEVIMGDTMCLDYVSYITKEWLLM